MKMKVSSKVEARRHGREDGLVPLGIVVLIAAFAFIGWCVRSHERPNMPHATMIDMQSTRAQL
jgi:hypothetical protein